MKYPKIAATSLILFTITLTDTVTIDEAHSAWLHEETVRNTRSYSIVIQNNKRSVTIQKTDDDGDPLRPGGLHPAVF